MRAAYSVLYAVLIIALLICTICARRSERNTRDSVAFLDASLILPIFGNLLIIAYGNKIIALTGCYLYYLGMDLVIYALVNFTDVYCKGTGNGEKKPTVMYVLLAADAIQLLLNPFTGHAFDITAVSVEGYSYYRMIPHWGQTFHRIIDYGIFLCVILIFIIASVKTPKISRERYTVLLTTMLAVGLLLTYNIFFQYAIDRSMIGFGIFGIIIYYFALLYRPLRLMDRVLSNIVSNLSDAFYIFDPSGNCVWANEQGCRLVSVSDYNYDMISDKLIQMFGTSGNPNEHIAKLQVGEGDGARYFILEENQVRDEREHTAGSYLRIQDITKGEIEIRSRDEKIGQFRQKAYQDALTGVGNKTAYNAKIIELNEMIAQGDTDFAVVMADMNNLKRINDEYGHRAGDEYIKGCCHMICDAFKHSPVYRIGGDEFVVILQGHDFNNRLQITQKLNDSFSETFSQNKRKPWLRYSASIGMAELMSGDSSIEIVFRRADKAMYEEKRKFKELYGSYR